MRWIINKGKPHNPRYAFIKKRDECLNIRNHLYGPHSYTAWHEWAEGMARRGYEQSKCPDCGFWMIWTKTTKKQEALDVDSQGTVTTASD